MTNKIRTVKVSGGDYAKVADRLKKFREELDELLLEAAKNDK